MLLHMYILCMYFMFFVFFFLKKTFFSLKIKRAKNRKKSKRTFFFVFISFFFFYREPQKIFFFRSHIFFARAMKTPIPKTKKKYETFLFCFLFTNRPMNFTVHEVRRFMIVLADQPDDASNWFSEPRSFEKQKNKWIRKKNKKRFDPWK